MIWAIGMLLAENEQDLKGAMKQWTGIEDYQANYIGDNPD